MTLQIPVTLDYDVSPNHGFLSETPELQNPYFAKWEAIVADLHQLMLARKLRQTINCLPILSTDHLETYSEWKRAYVCLIFMLHGYVWGEGEPEQRIPPPLTIPLLQVCRHLELPPIATYAGLFLWNYRPVVQGLACPGPEDMVMSCTFTGTPDEKWFYLISVAIEAKGASTIQLMLDAIADARAGNRHKVTDSLRVFAQNLQELIRILERMYEICGPHVFYHRIRPFLVGSNTMESRGLPNGLVYDDGTGKTEDRRVHAGGSNGQSSLIQFFDIVLGISHSSSSDGSFITDMRAYMPGKHRRFLEHVAAVANIRQFVEEQGGGYQDLSKAYDACVEMMCTMRNVHLRMVARYVITPSLKRDAQPDYSNTNSNDKASLHPLKKAVRGTGGTDLMPFLSRIRNETSWSKIDPSASTPQHTLKPRKEQATSPGARPVGQGKSNHGDKEFHASIRLPFWVEEYRYHALFLAACVAVFSLFL